jgi:hypothetical protein
MLLLLLLFLVPLYWGYSGGGGGGGAVQVWLENDDMQPSCHREETRV